MMKFGIETYLTQTKRFIIGNYFCIGSLPKKVIKVILVANLKTTKAKMMKFCIQIYLISTKRLIKKHGVAL